MCKFLLAKNGLFRFRFDQELFSVSEGKSTSPCHAPGCAHSGPGLPFFTPACRFGRPPTSLIWILVSFHSGGQNNTLARRGPAHIHHRCRLRSGTPSGLDSASRGPRHNHKRQRPTIHIFIVGQPLYPPLHQTHTDHCLPSSVERPCRALPPPPEGCPPSPSGRSGLVCSPALGLVRYAVSLEGGFGFFAG